ncbi:MAG: ATP12 family protein, partial [Methylocella sp.]
MQENTSPEARRDQSFARPAAAADPIAMARRDLNKALPRRFYKEASAGERDGGLLGEWIDLASMPLTRIVNSAIDGVACQLEATVDEIVIYAGVDLICYRAPAPRTLTEAQAAAWDPILAFACEKLGAHFICTEGVVFVEQPEPARAAVKEAIAHIANSGQGAPFALAALQVMTTLTGSVLLALAAAHGVLTPTEAWIAAHVDEDFEKRAWGEDAEALRRRARQWREMEAAARLFHAVHG